MKTLKIKAQKTENGYEAVAINGEIIDLGRAYTNRHALYADLARVYNNTVWGGKKVHTGYLINID